MSGNCVDLVIDVSPPIQVAIDSGSPTAAVVFCASVEATAEAAGSAAEVSAPSATLEAIELEGPPGPPGAAGGIGDSYPFRFGDATPKIIGAFSGIVVSASVIVTEPFDGAGASLRLETSTGITLVDRDAIIPSEAARYETNPGVELPAGTVVRLVITPGVGATTGAGVVYMEISNERLV